VDAEPAGPVTFHDVAFTAANEAEAIENAKGCSPSSSRGSPTKSRGSVTFGPSAVAGTGPPHRAKPRHWCRGRPRGLSTVFEGWTQDRDGVLRSRNRATRLPDCRGSGPPDPDLLTALPVERRAAEILRAITAHEQPRGGFFNNRRNILLTLQQQVGGTAIVRPRKHFEEAFDWLGARGLVALHAHTGSPLEEPPSPN